MTDAALHPSTIAQDTLCIGCGYNLRGLEPAGRCPECALPIADSIRGDRLDFADPGWLAKLRFGTALKLWNIVLSIVVGFLGGLLVGVMGASPWLIAIITVIGSFLGLWATFCITTQEPRISLTEDPVTLRKVIRGCAVAAVAGSAAQQLGFPSQIPMAFWALVGLVAGLAGLIVMVGELVYFRRFATRARDFKLVLSTKRLMWSGGIAMALMVVLGGLASLLAAQAGGAPAGPATTTTSGPGSITMSTTATGGFAGAVAIGMACVLAPAALVLFFWYVRLLIRYRSLFQQAMEHSQRTAFVAQPG